MTSEPIEKDAPPATKRRARKRPLAAAGPLPARRNRKLDPPARIEQPASAIAPPPPGPQSPPTAPTPAMTPPAPAAPAERSGINLPAVEVYATKLRTLLLNLAFVGAFLLIVPLIAAQIWYSQIVIEPISVPDALAAQGLTADVVAHRLSDGLQDAQVRAKTSKESVVAIPNSQQLQFSIPQAGISIDSLIRGTRQFFGVYQTRISGEFVCADPACRPEGLQLRLRVLNSGANLIKMPPMGTTPPREYFADAAVQVLTVLDPFTAISATSEREPMRAITLARHLIRSHHKDAKWAHNLIGNIRSAANRYEQAAVEYRAALALDPNFRIARNNLAITLRQTGDIAGARAVYEEIAATAPDDVNVVEGLAEIALVEGKPEDAIAGMLRAAALAPEDPRYLARAGEIAVGQGKPDEAIGLLEKALHIDPSWPPALYTLGNIHLTASRPDQAEPIFRNFADFLPNDADAQALHGHTLMLLGSAEEAMARYERAIELEPKNPEHAEAAADALFQLERLPEAEQKLSLAISLDPNRAETYASLANIEKLTSRFDAAAAHYRRAAELDPDNPEYAAGEAETLFYGGRREEGIAALEQLRANVPWRILTHFTLGSFYQMVGRREDAIASYTTFLGFIPADPGFDNIRQVTNESLAKLRAATPATPAATPAGASAP